MKASKKPDERVFKDPDYIQCPKHNNSLTKMIAASKTDIKPKTAAKLLFLSEEEFGIQKDKIIEKLKKSFPRE